MIKKQEIPIFVHHETGEKAQAGKDQKQQYLKYCIAQAEKYQNEVYLFGDNVNKDWCEKWVHVNSIFSEKWKCFLNVFENYSTYPDAWAKGIFHRFFLFEEYARENNINQFFVLDSDMLVYAKLADIQAWDAYDFAAAMPYHQKLGNDIENNLRWTINAGLSYWTLEALADFTSFCIEAFTSKKDMLLKKWDFHQKYHYPGGICEMSLIYLWVQEHKIRFCNIVEKLINGKAFNSDVNGKENYYRNDYKCSITLNTKCLFFKNGELVMKTFAGDFVPVYNLHFIGDSKMLMHDYYTYGKLTIKTYLRYALRNARKQAGILYRRCKRYMSK